MLVKFGYFVSTTGAVGVEAAHVFDIVLHAFHVGVVAPVAHTLVRDCAMEPICPNGHESVCACGESGVQDVEVDCVVGVAAPAGPVGTTETCGTTGVGTAAGAAETMHAEATAARVLAPATPWPFVFGEPEQILIF